MSDDHRIAQAAQFLLEEHRAHKPFGPIPAACAARTLDEAYAVQEAFHALMAATHGPVAGYKIALTTSVMQQMVGFHEPVSGAILAQTIQQSSCTIRSTDYGVWASSVKSPCAWKPISQSAWLPIVATISLLPLAL